MKKLALISVVGLALSGCGGSGSDNNDSSSTLPAAKPSAAIGSVESVDAKKKHINRQWIHLPRFKGSLR